MCGREGEQTTHLKGGSVGVSSVLRAGYLLERKRANFYRFYTQHRPMRGGYTFVRRYK